MKCEGGTEVFNGGTVGGGRAVEDGQGNAWEEDHEVRCTFIMLECNVDFMYRRFQDLRGIRAYIFCILFLFSSFFFLTHTAVHDDHTDSHLHLASV